MAEAQIEQWLQEGLNYHRAGRLPEAESVYRRILQSNPNHAQTVQLLGVIAAQRNDHPKAVELIRQAIALDATQPKFYNNLGISCQALGDWTAAEEAFAKAIALNSGLFEAYNNLGIVRKEQGRFIEAIDCYNRCLQLQPDYAEAHSNLGFARSKQGAFDDALTHCRRAAELRPQSPLILANLAAVLIDVNGYAEAATVAQRVLALRPDLLEAQLTLSAAQLAIGQADHAIATCRGIIQRNPKCHSAYLNLANVFLEQRHPREAISLCDQALQIEPDLPEAHWCKAGAYLLLGDCQHGWAEYEYRTELAGYQHLQRAFARPAWDGRDITGRTLLLYTEQGLGDSLQFVRYIPEVAQLGVRVILECEKPLMELFASVPGVHQVALKGGPLPAYDYHAALMSLPFLLKHDSLVSIPAKVPYLTVPAGHQFQLPPVPGARMKVGVAWAGNPRQKNDHNRSMPLSELTPLFSLPDVAFYSLQVGPRSADLSHPACKRVIDLNSKLRDFADTAAALNQLDLMITVDTSVAHLSGALGRPTWTLVAFNADWRYLMDRADCPWYPTMRLFRQPARQNWSVPVAQAKAALEDKLSSLTR